MIYQTFQEATRARGARKIKIINLGLEPWEGFELGLQSEPVEESDRNKSVADYVREREDRAPNGNSWADWLQGNRIELNAMTTPEFINWLDGKMAPYDKLIPPEEVVAAELEERLAARVREQVVERILREAGVDRQVADALAGIARPSAKTLLTGIADLFMDDPERQWRDHVEAVTDQLTQDVD
jgi:hypothetical protein